MKKEIILAIFLLSVSSSYGSELNAKITSLANIRGNGAMEVCGIVENQSEGTTLVTIKHDESSYTTLTDKDGKWCQVIKRWTFSGKVDATAKKL